MFSAVHIGEFILKGDLEKPALPHVAVVMPVFNTKVSYLRESVESIFK